MQAPTQPQQQQGMPLPSFGLSEATRPRRNQYGKIIQAPPTNSLQRRQQNAELYDLQDGSEASESQMPIPQFGFPGDAWSAAQVPYQKQMGAADKFSENGAKIQEQQQRVEQVQDPKQTPEYNASIGRKIMGIAAGVMTGSPFAGYEVYKDISGVPREKQMQIEQTKLAGFKNLDSHYKEESGLYSDAGKNMSSTLDSIGRADQNKVDLFKAQQPSFDKVDYTDPQSGQNMTGQMSNKFGFGGWKPGQMAPGALPSKTDYEYRSGIDAGSGRPTQKLMPKSPVPGNPQASQGLMPLPGNTTEAFYNMTPPAKQNPQSYGQFERGTQQPNQQLAIFEKEMEAKRQSQSIDDKLESVAWDYYRGSNDAAKAKAAVAADQQLPPDQKERVKKNIDDIYYKMLQLTNPLDRPQLTGGTAPSMPLPTPAAGPQR